VGEAAVEAEPGVAPNAAEVAVQAERVVLPAVAVEDQAELVVHRGVELGVVSVAVRGVVPEARVLEANAADWAADCRPVILVPGEVPELRMAVRPWAPSAMKAEAPKPVGRAGPPVASA